MFDIQNFGFSVEYSFEVEGELCTSSVCSARYYIWLEGGKKIPLSLAGNFESKGIKKGSRFKGKFYYPYKREVNLKLSHHIRFKDYVLSYHCVSLSTQM